MKKSDWRPYICNKCSGIRLIQKEKVALIRMIWVRRHLCIIKFKVWVDKDAGLKSTYWKQKTIRCHITLKMNLDFFDVVVTSDFFCDYQICVARCVLKAIFKDLR